MKGMKVSTDREILAAYHSGMFIGQICRMKKVGIHRVRRVVRDE